MGVPVLQFPRRLVGAGVLNRYAVAVHQPRSDDANECVRMERGAHGLSPGTIEAHVVIANEHQVAARPPKPVVDRGAEAQVLVVAPQLEAQLARCLLKHLDLRRVCRAVIDDDKLDPRIRRLPLKDLRKLGVQMGASNGADLMVKVTCWPELLPLQAEEGQANHLEQTPVLFELPSSESLANLEEIFLLCDEGVR